MIFELLCIDKNEEVKSKSIASILLSLQSNDALWMCDTVVDEPMISAEKMELTVEIKQFDTSQIAIGERSIPAYTIKTVANNFSILEPFRMKLIDHLRDMKFSYVSILVDDASNNIANRTYPLIYNMENRLRQFITIVLVKKIGEDFIRYVVPSDTIDNAKGNKKNEPHFIGSGKVQNDASLLYFDALGKIVYGETIFNKAKPNSILEKVKIAINLDDLKKELLEGNFQKYFQDSFVKVDFSNKWDKLNQLRNKVAHNSYFLEGDYIECERLCEEVCKIIDEAYSKIDTIKLSLSDMELIKEAVDDSITEENAKTSNVDSERTIATTYQSPETAINYTYSPDGRFKAIDEATLILKLQNVSQTIPFVGLKYFVHDVLAKDGFSYDSIYTLINILIERGTLIISKVDNPYGEHMTTAIQIAEK